MIGRTADLHKRSSCSVKLGRETYENSGPLKFSEKDGCRIDEIEF